MGATLVWLNEVIIIQRTATMNATIQVNYLMVPNHSKSPRFVPPVNFIHRYMAPFRSGRAMNHNV